MVMHA